MRSTINPSPKGDSTGQIEVELSGHCIRRFNQRIRPCLDERQAEDELARLLSCSSEIILERPGWMDPPKRQPDAWALIGPDIALPLLDTGERFLAVTLLTRDGSFSTSRRRYRRRCIRKAGRSH